MPKLSIIIPVLNAGKLLAVTLDSVLQQSLKDIEVVCVDCGSADGSLRILEDYREKDSRIVILKAGDHSVPEAQNTGIKSASGEYIHFLFPGEYVFDHAYEALYSKAVKYRTDLLRCEILDFDSEKGAFLDNPQGNLSELNPGDFGRLLTPEKDEILFRIGAFPEAGIYSRTFLEENNISFTGLSFFSERTFFYEVIIKADRIMAAMDRLVCREDIARPSAECRDEYLDCGFRSVKNTDACLKKNQTDMELRERLLTLEFENLISCIDEAYELSGHDGKILSDAEEFAAGYDGVYSYILTAKFRDLQKKLSKPAAKKAKAKYIKVLHSRPVRPKVSVVVPIYNVEDYLNEALNSLTAQTMENIEFVCVNDGSTDSSLVILKEYAALDERFLILDGPNGGYGKAMNRGIDAARGKYMGILEPDDNVPADMFASLYKEARKNNADIVKADFYRFRQNPDGSRTRTLEKFTHDKTYYGRVICPADEQKVFNFVMNTWSGIYRLDFLRHWNIRHNETPGAAFQDNGFWFQTFCRAKRVMFLNTPFYCYRTDNPSSSENNRSVNSFFGEYKFIRDVMEQDPVLLKRFNKIYYSRKFNALIRNYWYLDPKYQPELLQRISEEFREVYDQGLLCEDIMMSSFQWSLYNKIVPDPDAYYKNICVSVIMPVYNSEKYLRQALDGILALNEIPFELICVDDGSDDDSLLILREYEERDFRVRVITQKNAGAGAARNAGLRCAAGEYVFFPDSDDIYDRELLRKAYSRALVSDADIVVFRSDEYIDETGKVRPSSGTISKTLIPAHQPFAGSEIKQNVFMAFIGWPWDKLFKREFVLKNNLRFQEIRTTNDLLFVFSAIVRAERIVTIDNILVHHRIHTGSLSVTREKSWHCFYDALYALKQQLIAWDMFEKLEQDFINYSLNFSLWHLRSIRGSSYYKLYDFLKKEGYAGLGMLSHKIDYFYNKNEYFLLNTILSSEADEFLFTERALTKEENRELKADLKETRAELARQNVKAAALNNLRMSETWKVGCVIMWLPKKIKKKLNKLRGRA